MIEIKNITEYIQLLKRIASRTSILASPGLLVVPTVTIAQISDCWKELAESERKFVLDFNSNPIKPLPEAQALFQKEGIVWSLLPGGVTEKKIGSVSIRTFVIPSFQ